MAGKLHIDKKHLNVDKVFCFVNQRAISTVNTTLFSLACSSRPLADTSNDLKIKVVKKIDAVHYYNLNKH